MTRPATDTLRRRRYLATVGAVAGGVGLAGCSSGKEVDGAILVEQRVRKEEKRFRLERGEVEEGDTINVYAESRSENPVTLAIVDTEGSRVAEEEIESEGTFSHTAETTGPYWLTVRQTGGAYVEVGVEN